MDTKDWTLAMNLFNQLKILLFNSKTIIIVTTCLVALSIYYRSEVTRLTKLVNEKERELLNAVRSNEGLRATIDSLKTSYDFYVSDSLNHASLQTQINDERFKQLEDYYTSQVRELVTLLENQASEPVTIEQIKNITEPNYSKRTEINYRAMWDTYCTVMSNPACAVNRLVPTNLNE